MEPRSLNRIFAGLAFAISLVTFLLTVQPTVPFWDCGEFSAAATHQQVPHPPGAPLFLMLGKFFQLMIPFGDLGWRVNLVSVFSSALSVMLLYLITVMAIENWRGRTPKDMGAMLAVYGSSFVGAMAFCFSDTFWFNAVESEVYAASTLFVAIITWLMMKWNAEADNPGHERYILLIAYLLGLSTGVHLLSVLAIFSIVFVVYFRKYQVSQKGLFITAGIAVVVFFAVYPGLVKYFPALLGGDLPFKTAAKEYYVSDNTLVTILGYGLVAVAAYLLWRARQTGKSVIALGAMAFLLMFVGYSNYLQILVRANALPPMNENAPTTMNSLVSYLGREQYGDAPFWPRRYQTEGYFRQRHEQYGDWYAPDYKEVTRLDGTRFRVPDFKRVNTAGELKYLWEYQMYHMYFRYLLWNFAGRVSDTQDASAGLSPSKKEVEVANYESGMAHLFPIRFFGIPLMLGLFGLFFYFSKDKKMAFVYLTMFLMMGVLAAIQQNQQNPQPRERDYFYVGSFMVFAMWIGLGVYGLIDGLSKRRQASVGLVAGVFAVSLAVPAMMAAQGWKFHSRAGNYLAFDYAYNILQSVEKDAIVFTNGDNDTFPVWYMQDVEGVRRDVRIVNLSLGNTLWYVNQLKNESPWGAKKIPLSFTDAQLQSSEMSEEALSYDFGPARNVSIPVSQDILKQYTNDPAVLQQGAMNWRFIGERYTQREGQDIFIYRVQDLLVYDILAQVKFERPVYYSISVGGDAHCGLENYFRLEGMAYRICPVPQVQGREMYGINEDITWKSIMEVIPGDTYYKEPHYGFKLRNLNNPDVYYDEVHRRLLSYYRTIYVNFAQHLQRNGKKDKAIQVLDKMNELISLKIFPVAFPVSMQISNMYKALGNEQRAKEFAEISAESCKRLIDAPHLKAVDMYAQNYPVELTYIQALQALGRYDEALLQFDKYVADAGATGDPSARIQRAELEIEKFDAVKDYAKAYELADKYYQEFSTSGQQLLMTYADQIRRLRDSMAVKAGKAPAKDTALSVAAASTTK